MKRKILIIADRTPAQWPQEAASQPPDTDWIVFPLGLIPEAYAQSNASQLLSLPRVRYASASPFAEVAQERVRALIPTLVEELARHPGKTGVGYRESLNENQDHLWWCLEMTEKSAFRGRWIQNLYFLCVVDLVVQAESYDDVWIDTEDPGLAAAFKSWTETTGRCRLIHPRNETTAVGFYAAFFKRLLRVAGGVVFTHVVCQWIFSRTVKGKIAGAVGFFSFYPFFWDKAFTTQAQDRFFGEIPERIRQQTPVCFLVWLDLKPLELMRRSRAITDIFKSRNIQPVQLFLSIRRIGAAVHPRRIRRLIRFYRDLRAMRVWKWNGFNIAPLLRDELVRDLCSRELWLDLFIREGLSAVYGKEKPQCLLYRAEFQPYETALGLASRDLVPTVGFQHAAIGRNHLGYRWTSAEGSARPTRPDYLICTGRYAANLFRTQEIPADRLGVCGPARYDAMFRYFGSDRATLRQRCDLLETSRVFFIAATVVWAEVFNILEILRGALHDPCPENLVFLFKCHPSADFTDKIRDYIDRNLRGLAYKILPHGVAMYDFVAASDALLSTGGTLSLEGLCLGVMPIVFEDGSRFSVNPMLEAREGLFSVTTSDELRLAIGAVAEGGTALELKKRHWPAIIEQYFMTLEGDPIDRFLSCLGHWNLGGLPDKLQSAPTAKLSEIVSR